MGHGSDWYFAHRARPALYTMSCERSPCTISCLNSPGLACAERSLGGLPTSGDPVTCVSGSSHAVRTAQDSLPAHAHWRPAVGLRIQS
jgi:hypothetical protein